MMTATFWRETKNAEYWIDTTDTGSYIFKINKRVRN